MLSQNQRKLKHPYPSPPSKYDNDDEPTAAPADVESPVEYEPTSAPVVSIGPFYPAPVPGPVPGPGPQPGSVNWTTMLIDCWREVLSSWLFLSNESLSTV
jgi:hypothetical protein